MGQSRGRCPSCGQVRKLTPKSGVLYLHGGDGAPCPGSGQPPAVEPVALTKNPVPTPPPSAPRPRKRPNAEEQRANREAREGRERRAFLQHAQAERDAREELDRLERVAAYKLNLTGPEKLGALALGVAAVWFLVSVVALPVVGHFKHNAQLDTAVTWACDQFREAVRTDSGQVSFMPPQSMLESYDFEEFDDGMKAECGDVLDEWYAKGEPIGGTAPPMSDCDRRRLAAARGPFTDEEERAMMQAINNDPACQGQ